MRAEAFPMVALVVCAWLSGCGGRTLSQSPPHGDAAPDLQGRIGPVDLTQAPPTLAMACPGATGALAFEMPCLVGMNLLGSARGEAGLHVTECRMAQAGEPLVWSFQLPLGALAKDPGMVVRFPGDVPSPPPPSGTIDLRGEKARVSAVTGTLSFSRVDPEGRAFIGSFSGKVVWRGAAGMETTCDLDGPFWGAPGDFL